MLYYLTIAFQAFCVYHCIKNQHTYYWIIAIVFLPVVGALLYLFMNVISKRGVQKVQEDLTSVLNPGKKIMDLEKKFEFSATFQNQIALADAYLEAKMFDKAILNYEASLKDVFLNDPYALTRLLEAYYYSANWDKVLVIADKLKDYLKFKKTKASFLYALALEKEGNIVEAEEFLTLFDAPYSYYEERLELVKFYIRNAQTNKAKTLIAELLLESERMSKSNFKQHASVIKSVKELQKLFL